MRKILFIFLLLIMTLSCRFGSVAQQNTTSTGVEIKLLPQSTPTDLPKMLLGDAWQMTLAKLSQTDGWSGETGIMVERVQSRGPIRDGRAGEWYMVVVSADEQRFATINVLREDVIVQNKQTDAGLHRPFFSLDKYRDTDQVTTAAWDRIHDLKTKNTYVGSISIWPENAQPECRGAFVVSFHNPAVSVCVSPDGQVTWASQ